MTDTSIGETQRDARSRNESIVRVLETDRENVTVKCECGQEDCTQLFTIETPMYAKVRRQRSWLLLAAGHEVAAKERVVLRQSKFVVVHQS